MPKRVGREVGEECQGRIERKRKAYKQKGERNCKYQQAQGKRDLASKTNTSYLPLLFNSNHNNLSDRN